MAFINNPANPSMAFVMLHRHLPESARDAMWKRCSIDEEVDLAGHRHDVIVIVRGGLGGPELVRLRDPVKGFPSAELIAQLTLVL